MKLFLTSDIHTEFHADLGQSFINTLHADDVDICVIAGDLGTFKEVIDALHMLCQKFHHVIYVMGNHEAYGCTIDHVRKCISSLKIDNLHFLDNSATTINGQRFIGGTMWFGEDVSAPFYQKYLSDFARIINFHDVIYKENTASLEYLTANVKPSDIVVTHHLPSVRSIDKKFASSPVNIFYICYDASKIIANNKPKLWLHGHTHSSNDYVLDETRVVSNPFGYIRHQENEEYNEMLRIDV
jgi:Icc-related predicted phosphoesterase